MKDFLFLMKKLLFVLYSLTLTCFMSCNQKKIADISIDRISEGLIKATKTYDELGEFNEGLARVCKDKKYGFIDKLGKEIISCQFDDASSLKYGVIVIDKGGKEGLIDINEKIIVPCKFDFIGEFGKDSLAEASLNDKIGLIDIKGNTVVPFEYEEIGAFNEDLVSVKKNGYYGFINKKGEIVIPCIYNGVYSFSEGLAGVYKDGNTGFINQEGEMVIVFNDGLHLSPCGYFSSGFCVVTRGGLSYGKDHSGNYITKRTPIEMAFINKNGDLVSDFFARDLSGFLNGYCVVTSKDGMQGLINTHGEFTIPCRYSDIRHFDQEYALIQINGKSGFARKSTGEVVVPCIYETPFGYQTEFREGLVPMKKNGKFGYINEENDIVIPFNYDWAGPFSEGFAVVKKYGKYGYVDRYGNDTFPN